MRGLLSQRTRWRSPTFAAAPFLSAEMDPAMRMLYHSDTATGTKAWLQARPSDGETHNELARLRETWRNA